MTWSQPRLQSQQAENQLLNDEDQTMHVTFTMTQVPTNPSPKPQMLSIDHPFLTENQRSRVCVIVKDPARAFKDQIQDLNIPTIAKVIGFDKLKRNFKQYKDKRNLLKEYDSFLADLRPLGKQLVFVRLSNEHLSLKMIK